MKQVLAFFLLLVAFAVNAQTKSTITGSSFSVVTGTTSATALVDKQDSVTVYGTWAKWKNAPAGASATVTTGAKVRLTLDSLKTYQNLFVNITSWSRIKISVSTNDTTYTPIKTSFISAHGLANRWVTVPIKKSIKYIRFEFVKPKSAFRLNEVVVTK